MPSSLSGGQISPEVELDHFFTSLIGKDAAGGLTLLTQPGADGRSGGRLSPPLGPSPACSLPPSPFRDMPYWFILSLESEQVRVRISKDCMTIIKI